MNPPIVFLLGLRSDQFRLLDCVIYFWPVPYTCTPRVGPPPSPVTVRPLYHGQYIHCSSATVNWACSHGCFTLRVVILATFWQGFRNSRDLSLALRYSWGSSLFWDVTQRCRLVLVTDVSGQHRSHFQGLSLKMGPVGFPKASVTSTHLRCCRTSQKIEDLVENFFLDIWRKCWCQS
jgi:hypothetical protein